MELYSIPKRDIFHSEYESIGSAEESSPGVKNNTAHQPYLLPSKTLKLPKRPNGLVAKSCLFIFLCLAFTSVFIFWAVLFDLDVAGTPSLLPCAPTAFFDIDLASGSFTYTEVKIIDATWNVLVGRGVQTCAAIVCWIVFKMTLLRLAQQNRIRLDLYTAISFGPHNFMTIPKMIRGAFARGSWRARSTFAWMVVATTYILALPTILDVMTGYTTNIAPYIRLSSGDLALFDEFSDLCSGNGISMGPDFHCQTDNGTYVDFNVNGTIIPYNSLIDNSGNWIYSDTAFTCVPSAEYLWGMSTRWFMILCCCTMLWLWGMFGLWYDAQRRSPLFRQGRNPGQYRDLLDISDAIREQLGTETSTYGDKELSEVISKLQPVGFEVDHGEAGTNVRLCANPTGQVAAEPKRRPREKGWNFYPLA